VSSDQIIGRFGKNLSAFLDIFFDIWGMAKPRNSKIARTSRLLAALVLILALQAACANRGERADTSASSHPVAAMLDTVRNMESTPDSADRRWMEILADILVLDEKEQRQLLESGFAPLATILADSGTPGVREDARRILTGQHGTRQNALLSRADVLARHDQHFSAALWYATAGLGANDESTRRICLALVLAHAKNQKDPLLNAFLSRFIRRLAR